MAHRLTALTTPYLLTYLYSPFIFKASHRNIGSSAASPSILQLGSFGILFLSQSYSVATLEYSLCLITIDSCHTPGSLVISSMASVISVLAVTVSVYFPRGMPGKSVLGLLLFKSFEISLLLFEISAFSGGGGGGGGGHFQLTFSNILAFPPCVTVSGHFLERAWQECPEIYATRSCRSRVFKCFLSQGNQLVTF